MTQRHRPPRPRPNRSHRPPASPPELRGGPEELVAYPAVQLGFLPWDSVCLVGTRIAGRGSLELGPVARFDLAALRDGTDTEARAWVTGLGAQFEDADYGALLLVLYTDPARTFREARADPQFAALLGSLDPGGELGDGALLVAGDAWGHLRCAGAGCCAPAGRELAEVLGSRLLTRYVLAGHALAASREDLAVAPCTVPGCVLGVEEAAARHGARCEAEVAWLTRACDAWTGAIGAELDAHGAPPSRTGRCDMELLGELAAALAHPVVRDAVLAWLLGAPCPEDAAAVASWVGGEGVLAMVDPGAVVAVLRGGQRPGIVAECGERVLARVAAHAQGTARVQALAGLGYLRWWLGQGAGADVVLDQALRLDPDHSLALLARQIVQGRVPPPWVSPGTRAGELVDRRDCA